MDARRKERNDLLIPLYSNLAQAACGAFFGENKMLRKMWEHSGILCVCAFPTSRKVWPFTWEDGVELIAHFHHSDDFIRYMKLRRYLKGFIADSCSTLPEPKSAIQPGLSSLGRGKLSGRGMSLGVVRSAIRP